MNWETIFFSIILPILTWWIGQFILKPNRDFFKIIEAFKQKLPPNNKKGKTTQLDFYIAINANTIKSNISEKEFDEFLKQLEEFDYKRVFFRKKAIVGYSNNLQRLLNDTYSIQESKTYCIQSILETKKPPYLWGVRTYHIIKC